MTKMKIIIAGIGGVGGYFGGLLAKHFYENESVEVNFVARGQNLKEIQKNGLKVIKGETHFIAKPKIATDNPIEIGISDLIIICTKSYDFENILQQLQPCINDNTIILPLLNGVNNKEKIKSHYPKNIVLDGCVYIVSRLKQNGVIENSGNIQTLYFGVDNYINEQLIKLETLFKLADIEATLSQDISTVMWEKFIFLSPIATATSYFDYSVGEILSNIDSSEMIKLLIEEVSQLAKAKSIKISDDIVEKTLTKLKSLPYETTSSMHNDFKSNKGRNELGALTTYVIKESKKYNLITSNYEKLNVKLEKKSGI